MADLYFTYGSNLDTDRMQRQCPGATVAGPARLTGYRLAFSRYSSDWRGGVADIVPAPGEDVWGLLYTLTPDDLQRLDKYADCPRTYHRHFVEVETPTGAKEEVWTYTVVEKLSFIPPPSEYLRLLLSAAAHWGFPEHYRAQLRTTETKEVALAQGTLYFAYGSNLDTAQMQKRCPQSRVLGPACLEGYRLTFDRSSPQRDGGGIAGIVPDPTGEVWGLLYALGHLALARLDRYEGYPSLSERRAVQVTNASSTWYEAWAYMGAKPQGAVAPAPRYLNTLSKAAERWGFPESYKAMLRGVGSSHLRFGSESDGQRSIGPNPLSEGEGISEKPLAGRKEP